MRKERPIPTDRLILEPLEASHASRLYTLLADSRLYTFLPLELTLSVEELTSRFIRLSAGHSPEGNEEWLNWAVRLRAFPGDYVGTVQATIPESRVAMIAYCVFSSYQGQGFAQEAVQGMLTFLFRECSVVRADAYIDTRNERSKSVVEALGFIQSEVIKDADFFKGCRSDEYRYSLPSISARPAL